MRRRRWRLYFHFAVSSIVLAWLTTSGGAASLRSREMNGELRPGVPTQPVKAADEWLAKPVDDRIFRTYLDFFTYDRRAPFELKVLETTEREGIRKEHLSFESTPGVRVFANLYQSIGSAPRNTPALIFLHGAGIGGKNSRPSLLISEMLTRAGTSTRSSASICRRRVPRTTSAASARVLC